jgi:fatty acid desaturase
MKGKYYRTKIDTEKLRKFHDRSNVRGFFRVIGHFTAIGLTGLLFFKCSEIGWWIPALAVLFIHGTIFSFLGYAGASHELSHNTVFKERWVNNFFLQITSFLVWTNLVYFSRTHTVHHRSTLEHDVDIEVPTTKCITIFKVLVTSLFDVARLFRTIKVQWANAQGIVAGPASELFPPENTQLLHQLKTAARTILIGHFSLAIIFILNGYWQMVFLFSLSGFIGNGLPNLLASAQHCGMKMDTGDYRESTRTVLLNPIFSFFYWNMNYHVEHHMYPGVPCYNLPYLRKLIANDLGPATNGILGILQAVREDRKARKQIGDCALQAN